MIPLLPLLLLGTSGWFGAKYVREKRAFTPERRAVFERAINNETIAPAQLRELAAAFRKEGLPTQAALLEKRAALKEAPPDVKARRRAVFQKALSSTDPDAILEVAKAHEKIGALGAAETLREHAETVRTVKEA